MKNGVAMITHVPNKINESEIDDIIAEIDDIITAELAKHSFILSHLELLCHSTGVNGDRGIYGRTIVFSAKNQKDEYVSDIQWDLLKRIQQNVLGKVQQVSRVLYEIPCEN